MGWLCKTGKGISDNLPLEEDFLLTLFLYDKNLKLESFFLYKKFFIKMLPDTLNI